MTCGIFSQLFLHILWAFTFYCAAEDPDLSIAPLSHPFTKTSQFCPCHGIKAVFFSYLMGRELLRMWSVDDKWELLMYRTEKNGMSSGMSLGLFSLDTHTCQFGWYLITVLSGILQYCHVVNQDLSKKKKKQKTNMSNESNNREEG